MLLLLLQITPEQRRNRQPTQKESSESIPRFIQYYRPLQREIGPYIYTHIVLMFMISNDPSIGLILKRLSNFISGNFLWFILVCQKRLYLVVDKGIQFTLIL